jgi:hypothetical protein
MLRAEVARASLRRNRPTELVRLARYSEQQLLYYANQVPVIFAFRYADNAENQRRGRVGGSSGFRQGVRNLNFVPDGQHPKRRGRPLGLSIRYYDMGRQAWRSFRRGNLVSISAFWSVALQRFVDTPEQAGIERGKEFEAAPNAVPQVSEARQARSQARQQRKQEERQFRARQKSQETNRRDARRRAATLPRTR